jgi:hypothetical protein
LRPLLWIIAKLSCKHLFLNNDIEGFIVSTLSIRNRSTELLPPGHNSRRNTRRSEELDEHRTNIPIELGRDIWDLKAVGEEMRDRE